MNIVNYELFEDPSILYVISIMGLFIVLVILGGLLTDLLTYPDSPSYLFGALLSIIIALACTHTYVKITQDTGITYEVRITYENTLGKPINVSEKDIIAKIQNNDIATDTKNKNYIYNFEIDKELYKELEKLEKKKSQRARIRPCKFYKRLGEKQDG